MKIEIDKKIYSKNAVLKTSLSFIDNVYIHLSQTEDNWIIEWKSKTDCELNPSEFENELINQQIRDNLIEETKDTRKLILARAFASTIIDAESNSQMNFEDIDDVSSSESDGILRGWFDDKGD